MRVNHDRHAGHSVAMFRDKFLAQLPPYNSRRIWSTDVQHWLGLHRPSFPVEIYSRDPRNNRLRLWRTGLFIRAAWGELSDRNRDDDAHQSAIIVAFGTSVRRKHSASFEIDVWWEVASLITIMVLATGWKLRAISQARGALNALRRPAPDNR